MSFNAKEEQHEKKRRNEKWKGATASATLFDCGLPTAAIVGIDINGDGLSADLPRGGIDEGQDDLVNPGRTGRRIPDCLQIAAVQNDIGTLVIAVLQDANIHAAGQGCEERRN